MPMQFSSLEAEALKLSPEERVLLADHLLASVAPEGEVERAWGAEVERRLREVESGASALVAAEEAIARARQALR